MPKITETLKELLTKEKDHGDLPLDQGAEDLPEVEIVGEEDG